MYPLTNTLQIKYEIEPAYRTGRHEENVTHGDDY